VSFYISTFKGVELMSAKKFLYIVLAATILLILLFSTFFYYIDPLYFYRNTELYRPQYAATERYQMAGLIKNQEYKTLFTSTSMGRNFYEHYADKQFKTKSFNAALPASTAKEQSMVAELALREKGKLDQIIWELNYYSFSSEDPEWVMGKPSDFPTYMYDESKINDIKYLFNSYTFEVFYRNLLANSNGDEYNREVTSLYKFYDVAPPESVDRIQKSLKNVAPITAVPVYESADTMLTSFKYNVIDLAKKYPDTKFTLFFAPYPVYNHVVSYLSNPDYLKERIMFKKDVYDLISKYENIELYDFQDEERITFNIGNYYGDGVHYYEFVNNWIIDYLAEKPPIQSLQEYSLKLDRFEKQITQFDTTKLINDSTIKEKYIKNN
jgi:cytochrome c-type biogenesis protein CcmE